MIDVIIFLVLLCAGYWFGTSREKKHFASLIEREAELADILIIEEDSLDFFQPQETMMMSSSAVIALDYFKQFIFSWINIFGGRVGVFETLLDRARREVVVRLKQQVRDQGYTMLAHVRFETSTITQGANKRAGSVALYAIATAVKTS